MTSPLPRVADAILEGTVVGSFSKLGYLARRRLAHWEPELPRIDGKVAVVTGATSGLGLSTATRLARLGATVHFLARDHGRAERARELVLDSAPGADVRFTLADMGDLTTVRAFASEIREAHERLDVLVHNVGALHRTFALSAQGVELTVASHVLAQFELTTHLLGLLHATPDSRVVTVSSGGMYTQALDVDTVEMSVDDYDGVTAYARAKRMQVALNGAFAERNASTSTTFAVMHPGWADTPGVDAALPGFARVMGPLLRSVEQGSDTIVWLASVDVLPRTAHGIWLDRRLRSEHKLPWTRRPEEHARAWEWVTRRRAELP